MVEEPAVEDPAVDDSRPVGKTIESEGVTIVRYESRQEGSTCPVSGFDSAGNRMWHLEMIEPESSAINRRITRLWESIDGEVRILDDEGWTHALNPKSGNTEQLEYTERVGENTISLKHPVENRAEFGDVVVILLRFEPGTPNRNVFAYDSAGNELWTIEPASNPHGGQSVYTGLWNKEGDIHVQSFHGWKYRVNPADGSVTKLHRVK